jgi:hypothetical protein
VLVVPVHVGGVQKPVRPGKEDVEDPVVDDALELAGDGGEQRVGIEDGRDLADDGQRSARMSPGSGGCGFEAISLKRGS